MDARARLSILVVATAVGAWAGIRAHDRALATTAPDVPATEAPVAAPKNLIAEATLASPDATWRKIQVQVGGIVLLAPPTFGGVVAAFAREPSLSAVIDGGAPAYGALGDGGAWVVAAHVLSPQRAHSTLAEGQAALPSVGRAGSMELLHRDGAWIGLAGSFVIVGSDRAALETLGPYAYRTLPTEKLPESALAANANRAALSGPIRGWMQHRWADLDAFLIAKDDEQRTLHGGREPDLADPKVVVSELDAIEKTYEERIAGMDKADFALDVDDDGLHARVTLTPPHEGDVAKWVEALEGGSTAPLAASSQDAIATIFWRGDENDRQRAAKETSDTLTRALGSRVPAADEAKLGEILASIAKARAGWALASVTGGAQLGGLLRFASNDPQALDASIASAIDLARKPAWAKWESDALGVTKIDRSADQATFTTTSAAFQAAWAVRGGEVDFAAGVDAASVLATASPPATLASDAKVSAWLHALRSSVVWAIVARPLVFSSSPRSDALLIALEHGLGTAVLDARASGVLVRELVVATSKGL